VVWSESPRISIKLSPTQSDILINIDLITSNFTAL
jgi:hypothetical protein